MHYLLLLLLIVFGSSFSHAQTWNITDDFEGNGNITSWIGDDCGINPNLANPVQGDINASATVLEYRDTGGQYANARFDIPNTFDLSIHSVFSLKIYVPASGVGGMQPNQISLKLQNANQGEPWTTQCEIIKPIMWDEWQTVIFDFRNDVYFNLDPNSLPPTQRRDFNRVLIQINGENNNDPVVAYLDDIQYDGSITVNPVFNNLVWSDEFDGEGAIDTDKWFHQTQLPAGGSWFNGEIQHYTNRVDNTYLSDGRMYLVAQKETFTDQGYTKQYTSARLNSKFAFQYGRVEVRAKLPTGGGTWPAIWTLGKNITESGAYWQTQGYGTTGWPACGEIDIMEHWGFNQNFVQSAIHTPSSHGDTQNKGGQTVPTVSDEFHVYAVEWTAEKMVFSIDDVVHYTYDPAIKNAETWPFDAEQYLLLNIAIQPSIDPGFTEDAMEVDYVRVYQEGGLTNTPAIEPDIQFYYPNPVERELNIELLEGTDQNLPVKIYNIEGKLIRTYILPVNGKRATIRNLAFLSKGMYLLTYELKGRLYSHKFVKK